VSSRLFSHSFLRLALIAIVVAWLAACRPAQTKSPTATAPAPELPAPAAQTSESCRACHAEAFAAWSGTDHHLANRRVDLSLDSDAFIPARDASDAGARFHIECSGRHPQMLDTSSTATPGASPVVIEMILGNLPARQMLASTTGGRWQAVDLAWDPNKKEWFNVFPDEHRKPGEWGHWTGRGMNWNSNCAHCHMTGFEKGYRPESDCYSSTWIEQGVGCIQCHGPQPANHATVRPDANAATGADPVSALRASRQQAMQTCAPCHARNELLTPPSAAKPGSLYADHHRITLPTDPAVYYPDGKQRDEVFNYGSVLLSRMGHAGVTCLDCHDPHTSKTILPVANNALCMQCHATGGTLKAPVINPTAHSRHAEGSTGNQCVQCHMPVTNYIVRSPRHDHGWTRPDPLLTRELGIPNACSTCHADKPVDWAVEAAARWYGDKPDSRQRTRTRAIAAAQAGAPDAAPALLTLLKTEDVPAWRATLLELASRYAESEPAVVPAARAALTDTDPLVRAAAVRALSGHPEAASWLRPSLADPVRLVRLDAAWALPADVASGSSLETELRNYLAIAADQPLGQLRLGQYHANRGDFPAAEAAVRKAVKWEPLSAAPLENLALVQQAADHLDAAADSFFQAGKLAPKDASLMLRAGLAYAQTGRLPEAEHALREAVARDPSDHRTRYNLALLLAQAERLPEAVTLIQETERLAPTVADYPYARATLHLRLGQPLAADAALARALAINPSHPGARALAAQRSRK